MDHPRPTLRYVEAKELTEAGLKLNGLEVDGNDGEKLGKIDGFILDVANGRPYHIVVDAGGWFTHKHFLLPIGHAALNADGTRLSSDLSKDRVKRFPGFDKGQFEKLTDDDVRSLDAAMSAACCNDEVVVVTWETGNHYRYPDWWQESYYSSPAGDRRG